MEQMKMIVGRAPNLPWWRVQSMSDADIKQFNNKHLVEIKMIDDSLSDVSFCNTREGMHIKAKELGIKPYNLGCSCCDCNKEFDGVLNRIGRYCPKCDGHHDYKIDCSVGEKDGGYCLTCDTVWAAPGQCKCNKPDTGGYVEEYIAPIGSKLSVGKPIKIVGIEKALAPSVFEVEVWNAAIEAAIAEASSYDSRFESRTLPDVLKDLKK